MEKPVLSRLKNMMEKAESGTPLTIGFLGGSITQGSAATSDKLNYAYQVYEWWQKNYPQTKFDFVNAGVGGTSSLFGAARMTQDLLIYQPDFVVVDFSVNDGADEFFQETFEAVLRRILRWNPEAAVVVLNNVFYDTGENAEVYHNAVAANYNIPCVSMKSTLYQAIQDGTYTRNELTADGLHPNDKGHALVAGEIIKLLDHAKSSQIETVCPSELPKPLTANAYEQIQRWNILNSSPVLKGFRVDTEEKKGYRDFFKNGWTGSKVGDKIAFEVECSCLAVQYRKTIWKPSPVAKLVIDGDETTAVILDGNFEETWGNCLYLQSVLHHEERKHHTIEIEIIEATEEDKAPFYLLSMLVD
ncbi:SGNH/GDSL hydrolase family protein [Scatolibacter rhodanostii]|uniref:SGNH/GDSL hydrolase family protein n=1 Tax=Scatolibacter rhodanostii TaxID=2014781 RepID=UPI000C08AF64|nr:SGNH/GDSL hydrolase family protein [Scatolibacter rhodanostii]